MFIVFDAVIGNGITHTVSEYTFRKKEKVE